MTWHPSAIKELTRIWLDADDREAVTTATNAIEHELAHDPQGKGEEFYDDRLLVAIPLAVTFTVRRERPARPGSSSVARIVGSAHAASLWTGETTRWVRLSPPSQ